MTWLLHQWDFVITEGRAIRCEGCYPKGSGVALDALFRAGVGRFPLSPQNEKDFFTQSLLATAKCV